MENKDLKIEEYIKKILFTGIGLTAGAVNELKQKVELLVQLGEINTEQAKNMLEQIAMIAITTKTEMESKVESLADKAISKLNFINREEYSELQNKIMDLEAKLAKMQRSQKSADKKQTNK